MARLNLILCCILCLGALPVPVLAADVEVNINTQWMNDESFQLVSSKTSVYAPMLRVSAPMDREGFSWLAGYHYWRTDNVLVGSFDAGGELVSRSVWAGLALHQLEAGVRWSRPVSKRFTPYVTLSAVGVGGTLTLGDEVTGWTSSDPGNGENAAATELEEIRRFGLSGGGSAALGVQVWLARSGRVSSRSRTGPAAPTGSEVASVESTEAAVSTPVRRWAMGVTTEVGYLAMVPVRFKDVGSLGIRGLRVLVGVHVRF